MSFQAVPISYLWPPHYFTATELTDRHFSPKILRWCHRHLQLSPHTATLSTATTFRHKHFTIKSAWKLSIHMYKIERKYLNHPLWANKGRVLSTLTLLAGLTSHRRHKHTNDSKRLIVFRLLIPNGNLIPLAFIKIKMNCCELYVTF